MFSFRTTGAASPGFQGRVQIDVRRLPGWDETEDDAGGERQEKSEGENRSIEFDLADARNVLGHGRNQRFGPPLREEQSEQPADGREEHTLRQQLADNPEPAGAQGAPQRNFFSAHRRAGQHQIRHIRVRNQEQARDRAEQNVERGPDIADDLIAQRLKRRAEPGVRLRIFFLESAGDRAHLRIRLRGRDAWLQARDPLEGMTAALLRLGRASIRSRCVLGERNVHLDRVRLDRELESLRHHSDDGVGTTIQHQDAADHIFRAIELALPKSVGQDDLESAGAAARLFIRAHEAAAGDRLDAEDVEEFRAYFLSVEAVRFASVHQRQLAVAVNRDVLEAAVLFPEIEEIRVAHRRKFGRRSRLVEIDAADSHQLVRRRKRKRFQEDGVDDAEDRRVRADAEREGEDGDDGERRVLD